MKTSENIYKEINIGTLSLISTEGPKGHNCMIFSKPPIGLILLVDQEDPIELW